ncbi:MAG TPA: hypothetical protein DCP28_24435 [Cytophagales bacterium]|nr:hypothetical protein [Cytophagales bacterium]
MWSIGYLEIHRRASLLGKGIVLLGYLTNLHKTPKKVSGEIALRLNSSHTEKVRIQEFLTFFFALMAKVHQSYQCSLIGWS